MKGSGGETHTPRGETAHIITKLQKERARNKNETKMDWNQPKNREKRKEGQKWVEGEEEWCRLLMSPNSKCPYVWGGKKKKVENKNDQLCPQKRGSAIGGKRGETKVPQKKQTVTYKQKGPTMTIGRGGQGEKRENAGLTAPIALW